MEIICSLIYLPLSHQQHLPINYCLIHSKYDSNFIFIVRVRRRRRFSHFQNALRSFNSSCYTFFFLSFCLSLFSAILVLCCVVRDGVHAFDEWGQLWVTAVRRTACFCIAQMKRKRFHRTQPMRHAWAQHTHTHTHSRQNSLLLTLGTVRPAAARQLNKYNKYGIHGFDQKQEMAAPTVYTQHTLPTLCRFHSKYMEARGFGGVQQTQNGKFFNEVKWWKLCRFNDFGVYDCTWLLLLLVDVGGGLWVFLVKGIRRNWYQILVIESRASGRAKRTIRTRPRCVSANSQNEHRIHDEYMDERYACVW